VSGRWRERGLLTVIGAVGASNGFFLGLTLATLLALFLRIAETAPPPADAGPIGGAVAALAVVAVAAMRPLSLVDREAPPWDLEPPPTALEARWETLVGELAATAGLAPAPRLRFVGGEIPNAFAVGDRDGASIVVTTAALERLAPRELLAVLAHEVARIEAGDLRAVAFADSVQATVASLAELKGRYLWGPRLILRHGLPAVACMGAAALFVLLATRPALNGVMGSLGFVVALVVYIGWQDLGWADPIKRFAKRSWMAIFQFAIWMSLFGLMTLVEAILAWPTVLVLSRLLSRSRVFAADRRAVELTGDPGGLRDALEALAPVERRIAELHFGGLRFSLFATPRPPSAYRAWVERVTGTHPPTARRIERLGAASRNFAPAPRTVQDIPSDR
jgi:Zn-dependent protease with chaperone function